MEQFPVGEKVTSLAILSEETIVAVGLESNQIKIFDFESKENLKSLKGHT